jgi:hypothetical protein
MVRAQPLPDARNGASIAATACAATVSELSLRRSLATPDNAVDEYKNRRARSLLLTMSSK